MQVCSGRAAAQLCWMDPSISRLLKAFCAVWLQQHRELASWVQIMQSCCMGLVVGGHGRGTTGIQTCAFTFIVNAGSSVVVRHVMWGGVQRREEKMELLYFHNTSLYCHAAQPYRRDRPKHCRCIMCDEEFLGVEGDFMNKQGPSQHY